jgi:hypothetical protein
MLAATLFAGIVSTDPSMAEYRRAVDAYVTLHREVERTVPAQEITDDPREIQRAVELMADAMRQARPAAAEGDIFGAAAGELLRERIAISLQAEGHLASNVLMAMTEGEEIPEGTPLPAVNGRFSWRLPAFMPPCVLAVLPELPAELQYRFVGRDLVIVDLHANLVVDILREAFPVFTLWTHLDTPVERADVEA